MRHRLALALAISAAASAPSTGQELPRPTARALDFQLVGGGALRAELLAVAGDSIWILPPSADVRVLALRAVSQVRERQPGMTAAGLLVWAALGGLVSGAALTAACSTVEDASCGAVLPATLLLWLSAGGVAAVINGSGERFLATNADALRPYARFPQGLPAGFPLAAPQLPTTTRGDSVAPGVARRWHR